MKLRIPAMLSHQAYIPHLVHSMWLNIKVLVSGVDSNIRFSLTCQFANGLVQFHYCQTNLK